MIQSGRTQQASSELANWYNGEYSFVKSNNDWTWGVNKESLQNLLDTRSRIPFRDFLIRYVLYVHAEDFRKMETGTQDAGLPEKEWLEKKGKEVTAMAAGVCRLHQAYDQAPAFLKAMTDLVFQDFVDNRFCKTEKDGTVIYLLGSTAKNNRTLWDKNALLEKLICESIGDREFIAFAFGMNMSLESLVFFLQKAFNRPGLDVWKPEELFLYIVFRYVSWNKYAFWRLLTDTYAGLEKDGKRSSWTGAEGQADGSFSTETILQQAQDLLPVIDKMSLSFLTEEEGELTEEVLVFLREYKRLVQSPEQYSRTAVREMQRLISEFESSMGEDIEAAAAESRKPSDVTKAGDLSGEKISQGKVKILYRMKKGLFVPKGTEFIKDKKGEKIRFVSEDDVRISPCSGEPLLDVEIDVISEKSEPKRPDREKLRGYIKKHTVFFSSNDALSQISNKYSFKDLGESVRRETAEGAEKNSAGKSIKKTSRAAREIGIGEYIHTGGKLYARCREGARIPAGTLFWTEKPGEPGKKGKESSEKEKICFVSVKDMEVCASVEIFVHCTVTGEAAEKDSITDCSIPDWKDHFVGIRNNRIGDHQKKEKGNKNGKLCGYLYPRVPGEWEYEEVLDDPYVDKLGAVLEGTQFNPTRISNIRTGKNAPFVSRNDLITFSFLAYMSRLEKMRLEEGREAATDFGVAYAEEKSEEAGTGEKAAETKTSGQSAIDRFSGFIAETNRVLNKCGFYELYRPNPYDALIIYLVSSSEAVNAFRNLWGWYLTKKG